MLDRHLIRENFNFVQERLTTKGFCLNQKKFLSLDEQERSLRKEWEKLRAQRNRASEDIAELRKQKKDAFRQIQEMKILSARIKEIDKSVKLAETRMNEFLAIIPNLPHASSPVGADATCNQVVRSVGEPPNFNFPVRDHVDLGLRLGILDLERAGKIAGSRFANYCGQGALLERALINMMLDVHTVENGYFEIFPPFMANSDSFFGTGNLPKFKEDLFRVEGTDYFLVPTAEVPVTNLFAGEVLPEEKLPLSFVAYSPCFRSEAGSYGRDTRGLIRQHQFNKVELVKFAPPDDSYQELDQLTSNAEAILCRLDLPYRLVTLSTGDMSFSAAKTYDLEVWVPSQNAYREVSSCSNFEDFQARRANIRYKPTNSKRTRYVHTLNGSGLAVGRTWVAIVENFQQSDGTVRIPQALQPYMRGMQEIVLGPSIMG